MNDCDAPTANETLEAGVNALKVLVPAMPLNFGPASEGKATVKATLPTFLRRYVKVMVSPASVNVLLEPSAVVGAPAVFVTVRPATVVIDVVAVAFDEVAVWPPGSLPVALAVLETPLAMPAPFITSAADNV